ncbi:hypothetical protein ACLI09_10650 [Flavobacterium sp. RHBU_24]|uniref:hypothetical protein n=1 Tax=Flavobacterium sp. RHBU_24 TaxID=3391185 RepID=UPI003984ECDF
MKRKIVLLGLLVLPLVLYVYFSLVKHNQLFLPVITKNLKELPVHTALDGKPVALKGKISIVGFFGTTINRRKEAIFNLNQKINNKYKGFTDFQMVMLVPNGDQSAVKALEESLKHMGDISTWRFVFASPKAIQDFYTSFGTKEKLDDTGGSDYVFIVDKSRSLRGRRGQNKKGEHEYKDGYNTFIVSELHNDMTDDVKILLREYRLALRRNMPKGFKKEKLSNEE